MEKPKNVDLKAARALLKSKATETFGKMLRKSIELTERQLSALQKAKESLNS